MKLFKWPTKFVAAQVSSLQQWEVHELRWRNVAIAVYLIQVRGPGNWLSIDFWTQKMTFGSINKFSNSNISSIALQWYADRGRIRRFRGVMIKTSWPVDASLNSAALINRSTCFDHNSSKSTNFSSIRISLESDCTSLLLLENLFIESSLIFVIKNR